MKAIAWLRAGKYARYLPIAAAIIVGILAIQCARTNGPHDAAQLRAGAAIAPIVEPQRFEPLSPIQAERLNAQTPPSDRPIQAARPFDLKNAAAGTDWEKAVTCLTQANYYEAASEGVTGMRAVSQVVLNRVRHPAFPKSVCGVVFQGSQRTTGCQFTFTCDGSLARLPLKSIWLEARKVAEKALSGSVDPDVGMATHYHTAWVVPSWARALDKVRTLGAHIFYVWKGHWGDRQAFNGQYAGENSIDQPVTELSVEIPSLEPGKPTLTELELPGVPKPLADEIARLPATGVHSGSPTIKSDDGLGNLIADEHPSAMLGVEDPASQNRPK